MTGEGYESWRWGYWHGEDYVGNQSIKKQTAISKTIAISKEIAIKKVIEILIGDQVCDREQVGVDHDKRSRPEECWQHHWTRDQQGDRNQTGAIYIVIDDQDSVGYNGKIKNAPFNHETKK